MPSENTSLFISAEEKALLARVSGLTVSDLANPTRPVKVWFRNPQKEIEDADFPYITILFTGAQRAIEREHRSANVRPTYVPRGVTIDDDEATVMVSPDQAIPMDFQFVIATHCRNPMHDRELVAKLLLAERLPLRYGWLEVEDNTIRRLDVDPMVRAADFYDQNGVVVFRKEFRISVSSEQFLNGEVPIQHRTKPTVVTTVVEHRGLGSTYPVDQSELGH